MTTRSRSHFALLLVAATFAAGCGKKDAPSPAARVAPDAGATRVRIARTAGAGEMLADLDKSRLMLAMVKDKDFSSPVTATMSLRDGRVTLDGPSPGVKLSIDLTTFDSTIPVRNERVQKLFFETSGRGWDTAELVVEKLPEGALATLREKKRVLHVPVEGDLRLHGRTNKITVAVDASLEPDGALTVKTSAPFEIHISDYGLADNLRHLSSVCLHDSIEDVVKVELALRFGGG